MSRNRESRWRETARLWGRQQKYVIAFADPLPEEEIDE